MLIAFRPEFGYVVGADVGADKVLVKLADLRGEVVASRTVRARGAPRAANRLKDLRRALAGLLADAAVALPEGVRSADFLQHLQKEHGIFTLPGLGSQRDTAIRIGHMGVTAVPRCILHTLYAIEAVLTKMGHRVAPGTAVNRAEQVYADAQGRIPLAAPAS